MRMRSAAWAAALLLFISASGGFCQSPQPAPQFQGHGNAPGSGADFQGAAKRFGEVYRLVQHDYATPVNANKAIYGPSGSTTIGAIPAMLRTLDPHSNFFDPSRYASLRQEMAGKYFGVGMEIGSRPGRSGKIETEVMQPLPGSPAFKAGLRPGDIIWTVDGRDAQILSSTQVADLLRGPEGTVVHLTVRRAGVKQPLTFSITRQRITQLSVDDAFMVRSGIAYIRINTFNEVTNEQLSQDLQRLGENNIHGMILDLRGNLGGLLNQAVLVASHFLRPHQLVVYHYGRNSSMERYDVQGGETGPEFPMIVLIDDNTASAAEIVTGALQDHDRALVMGQRSFGKGLVQTEFPLSDKTMLLLVTARYYTPSGRLIQRDYSDLSLYDYFNHYQPSPLPHSQARLTDGGRVVYGGGGIAPDVVVPQVKFNAVQQELVNRGAFFDFGRIYLASHKSIPVGFMPDRKVLQQFKAFLLSENVALSNAEFLANESFISEHIRIQLVSTIYGEEAADKIQVENDPLVQRAIETLPQAAQLLVNRNRYMALRGRE
jgi:carboxyl-terminal processing protease